MASSRAVLDTQYAITWPDCCLNISDGGDGTPGNIHSIETRIKIGIKQRGKKLSTEHIAKMKAAAKNRSPKTRERLRVANRMKVLSPESRAKMRATKLGRKHAPETRAKMCIAHKNHPPEWRAKISATLRGRKRSPEHCENLRKAWERRRASSSDIAAHEG